MLSRRAVVLSPLTLVAARTTDAAATRMNLALHQTTSSAAGYRKSLEGWSRAGIKYVEITAAALDEFLKTESPAAARSVMTDLGLTPVSFACGVTGLWEPNAKRAAALDQFRKRCETAVALGIARIYSPTLTTEKFTEADYTAGVDNMRQVGEIAKEFRLTVMAEFARSSSFISTLTTMLKMTRAAAHPSVSTLLDCYHFWSGLNKLEDLDLIREGEIGHVHFSDVPDLPRELLDSTTRVIPGDGIAPLPTILHKLRDKEYAGALSVELFVPRLQQGDPYDVAREIRQKAESVMRRAGVY